MKKIFIVLFIIVFLFSCGGQKNVEKKIYSVPVATFEKMAIMSPLDPRIDLSKLYIYLDKYINCLNGENIEFSIDFNEPKLIGGLQFRNDDFPFVTPSGTHYRYIVPVEEIREYIKTTER